VSSNHVVLLGETDSRLWTARASDTPMTAVPVDVAM
jgi:hypothetical protein